MQEKRGAARKPPTDSNGEPTPPSEDATRWGDLPPKLHLDAEKARGSRIPERWRDDIERYRQATSE